MTRWLFLALALAAQGPPPKPVPVGGNRLGVVGVQQIPAYEPAILTATNATPPLNWSVYQLSSLKTYAKGQDFVFTAPPGQYVVILQSSNGLTPWLIQFTPPGPIPNPGPSPTPNPPVTPPAPIPGPQPQPSPDGGGFIYPPDAAGFAASVMKAIQDGPKYSADEAAAMSSLYSFVARKLALDGLMKQPKYKTFDDALALTTKTEDELLSLSTIRALKQAFPEVSKVARAELDRRTQGVGNKLTPENRAAYVEFLNLLAMGFDQAVAVPRRQSQ